MEPFCLPDLLLRNVIDRPQKVALTQHERHLTYQDVAVRALIGAQRLAGLGVGRGDRVCLHMPKSIEEVVETFAISLAGGVIVNANASVTPRMLRHILDRSQAKVLLTTERISKSLDRSELPPTLQHVVEIQRQSDEGPVAECSPTDLLSEARRFPRLVDRDNCSLIFTSGSTGLPKGVLLDHAIVVQSARSAATHLEIAEDERLMGVLPLSFDFGLSQLTTAMLKGATLCMPRAALVAELLREVDDRCVTAIAMVPTMWIPFVRLLQQQGRELEGIRFVANSGGALPTDVIRAWPGVFPKARHYLMYGMTEGFRSSYLEPADFKRKLGSIGKPLPNVELFVVHPEKGLCDPGEYGELIHRGSLISSGYYGDPQATADKIKPCPALRHLIGDEPVLYSGDTVYRDEDGFLWFVGRTSTFIKCSDFRISPTEVEEMVFSSGMVTDVVAFGVPHEELGQVVQIAVTKAAGADSLDIGDLLAYCRREMPPYMVPRKIDVCESEMPRTPNGKLDRPAVIAQLTERAGETRPAPT